MMKKIKLKDLLKESIREQTTPYYGDNNNIQDLPDKTSNVRPKYDCITIRKPGHSSGLEVGDQTCVESINGEFSTLDECRGACGGPDDVSTYTPFSCWNIEPWLNQNNIPGSEDMNFDITLDFFCQSLCTQYVFEQQFPVMCGCCGKETCYKCEMDGINTIAESFYIYGLTWDGAPNNSTGTFGCPPDWEENEEDACPNVDFIGPDNEDDDDEDEDDDGIGVSDTNLVPDAGVDDDEDEDDGIDDTDNIITPPKEGDEKITCYQCKNMGTENQQVITDEFFGDSCEQAEGWYPDPELACRKGRICYGCGINKGLTAFDQFISEPIIQNDLDGEDCPNASSDDFDGWYNTPEETQCAPSEPLEVVTDNSINEYICVWCPATDDSVGYYYIQSPEEGGTYGWNEDDGEPPVNVPMRPNGNGVLQVGQSFSFLGTLQPAHCTNFGTDEYSNFTDPEGELQQFCYDLGYNPIIPEDEIVNESEWTGDDIVNEDEPYSGPINCLYCPGVAKFWPDGAYSGGYSPGDINPGSISDLFNLPPGNQGWWNNSGSPGSGGDPSSLSSTLNNPSFFAYMVEVWGYTGYASYAGGQAQNYTFQWDDTFNGQVANIVNEINHGYWFLESWNTPGQGWDTDIDGPYPEGITLNPDSNLFKGINLSNCSYKIGTNEQNPFTVTTYYNPDTITFPDWAVDQLPLSNSSNDTMHSYCNANGFNQIEITNQLGYTEEDWTGIPTIDEGDCGWPRACNYGDPCPEEYEGECVNNCYWGCSNAQEHFGLFVGMFGFGPCASEIAAGWTDAICCNNCTSGCQGITNEFNQNWNTIIIEDVMGEQYESLCNTQQAAADAMGLTQSYLNYLNTALDYAQQGVSFIPGVSSNPTTGEVFETVDEYMAYANEFGSTISDVQTNEVFTTWGQICDGNFQLTDFMASFLPTASPTTLSDVGINIDIDLPDLEIFGINLGQEAEDFLQNQIDGFSINLGPQAIWSYIEAGINWVDCNYFNQWLELPAQTGVTAPCCDSPLWGFCQSNPVTAWINYMIDVGIDPNVLTYTDAVQGNYLENQSLYPAMGTSIATWQNNLFGPTLGNSYSGGSWGPYSAAGDGGWCLNGGAPDSVSGNVYESKTSKKANLLKERLQKLAGIKKRG